MNVDVSLKSWRWISKLTTFWEKRCNAPRPPQQPRASSSLEPALAGMLFPTFQGNSAAKASTMHPTGHAAASIVLGVLGWRRVVFRTDEP